MDRLRLGLLVVLAAHVAWLVAVLANGYEGYTVALIVAIVGMGLAAWAAPDERRVLGAIGFALAALGIGLFYKFVFFQGLPSTAGAIVLAGDLVAAVAAAIGHFRVLAIGMAIAEVGAMLWIIADGTSGLEWQTGNVLATLGAGIAAFAAWSRAPL
jgi:hypothetical protein